MKIKELTTLNKLKEKIFFTPFATTTSVGAGTFTNDLVVNLQEREKFDPQKEFSAYPKLKKSWLKKQKLEAINKENFKIKNLILQGFNNDGFYICLHCAKYSECVGLLNGINCNNFEYDKKEISDGIEN